MLQTYYLNPLVDPEISKRDGAHLWFRFFSLYIINQTCRALGSIYEFNVMYFGNFWFNVYLHGSTPLLAVSYFSLSMIGNQSLAPSHSVIKWLVHNAGLFYEFYLNFLNKFPFSEISTIQSIQNHIYYTKDCVIKIAISCHKLKYVSKRISL